MRHDRRAILLDNEGHFKFIAAVHEIVQGLARKPKFLAFVVVILFARVKIILDGLRPCLFCFVGHVSLLSEVVVEYRKSPYRENNTYKGKSYLYRER